LNEIQCYIIKENQAMVTIASKDFSFIVEDNLELIFRALNKVGLQLNMMQNSAISFIGCYNEDKLKTEELMGLLSDKFEVSLGTDNTLLTVFNYNDSNSELESIIGTRTIRLEQKSNSALQLLLN
jgi:aspartate kinase